MRSIFSGFVTAILLFCLIPLCACLPPKTKEHRPQEKVLAKVDEEPITLTRFHDYLVEGGIFSSDDADEDQKKKEEALHELIEDILIDRKALSLDLESDSSFMEKKNKYMNDFLLSYLHAKEILEKIEVTDQEIKDYYEKHRDEHYAIPEKRQIRRLLIKIKADSSQKDSEESSTKGEEEAQKEIQTLYQRAIGGEDFADLVRQYSEESGRTDLSGNMGYLERGKLSPPLDSVAFSLEVGEISPPVKDERGYHLISVLDIKKKEYRQFDEKVAGGIGRFLEEEQAQERTGRYLDQLKERTRFAYHEEILELPDSLVEADDWALIINDRDTIGFEYYASKISWYKYNMGKDSLTLADRKDLLRNFLALPPVLLREAERKGYRDSIDYQVAEGAFILEEARKEVKKGRVKRDFPPPTRQELEAYYQAHKIDYPRLGVPVHVYHIIFDDSLEAVRVLNKIRAGVDFAELAKEYYPCEPEIKDVAYDLGFITQGEMPQNFYQKALSLEVGEVSEPVRTEWGFHVIKVVGKEKEGKTFEDIIPEIEKDLLWKKISEHQENWEGSLFDEAKIWIDQKLLDEFQLDKPEG